MVTELSKVYNFADLEAWKKGHKIVLAIYKVTKHFPKDETFGLTSQMRRCSVSITSNLAEGFSRGTYKDKVHFYYMALGSITELQNQLLISYDVGYVPVKQFETLAEQLIEVHKITNGL